MEDEKLTRQSEKEQKTKEFWKAKRKKRKEKKKLERKESDTKHWREGLTEQEIEEKKEKFRRLNMWKHLPLEDLPFQKPTIVIDLCFTEHMRNKELRSVVTQLSYSYGFLRSAICPLELHLCSFDGIIKEMLENLQGFSSWKVFLHTEPFQALYDLHDVIYLSPDAEEELQELDEEHIYVIGGIVDHNRLKGLTKGHANTLDVRSVSLPIESTMGKTLSNSLNINHVYEILCKYKACCDWEKAFTGSVPTRKGFHKE